MANVSPSYGDGVIHVRCEYGYEIAIYTDSFSFFFLRHHFDASLLIYIHLCLSILSNIHTILPLLKPLVLEVYKIIPFIDYTKI